MYTCICVCVYIYMYLCVCVLCMCVYVYICVCVWICVYVCICVCVCVCPESPGQPFISAQAGSQPTLGFCCLKCTEFFPHQTFAPGCFASRIRPLPLGALLPASDLCPWVLCFLHQTFELWSWRRLLRVPWTARRSNQSILVEISPEYS